MIKLTAAIGARLKHKIIMKKIKKKLGNIDKNIHPQRLQTSIKEFINRHPRLVAYLRKQGCSSEEIAKTITDIL